MSTYDVWTIDSAVYSYAKDQAKARAQAQWQRWLNDPNSINLWTLYNSTQNNNWINPWFEKELGGFFNGPSVNGSPAYEVTQNAYMEYCFWKWKGHARYSTIAMLTIDWNETRMGHGAWEYSISPRYYLAPYNATNDPASLIGFDADRTGEGSANYTWYTDGAIVPAWTDSFFDESNHQTYTLTAPAGSWNAVKKRYIQTYMGDDGFEHPYIPLRFDPNLVNPDEYYAYEYVGYGYVQWTAWNRLVQHARKAFPGYGGKHWQYNGTLQMFTLDWERKTAMSTDPADQHSSSYEGEWVNSNATYARFIHNNVEYRYPYACTWDNWAADNPVTWCRSKCADLGITNENTIDEYCRQLMLDIIGACYLHSGYYHNYFSNVRSQSRYFGGAVDYWDNNGGWDVKDIPRPRDIPNCELDKYHLSQSQLVCCFLNNPMTRRKRRRVCTILL